MREQSSEQEKPIVLVGKRQGYTISFEIAPNRLECWCTYTPSGMGGSPMSEADLKGFLQQYKILEGVQEESIHRLLHAAATGTAVSNLLLAQGTPMVPGKNGYISLAVKADDGEPTDADSEKDVVDFRRVQVFLNVEPGDLIGTIIPPEPGTPGMTIHGDVIPAQAGAPLAVKLGKMSVWVTTAYRCSPPQPDGYSARMPTYRWKSFTPSQVMWISRWAISCSKVLSKSREMYWTVFSTGRQGNKNPWQRWCQLHQIKRQYLHLRHERPG